VKAWSNVSCLHSVQESAMTKRREEYGGSIQYEWFLEMILVDLSIY